MSRWCVALLIACVSAVEPATPWDYRPLVTYEDESLVATLPSGNVSGWHIDTNDRQPVIGDCSLHAGQVTLQFTAQGHDQVRLLADQGRWASLHFVRPGQARELTIGDDGLPLLAGEPAVLVLSRLEARADRRWALLREGLDAKPAPCAKQLVPPTVVHGRPVLIAQCAAAQAIDPTGGVLLELSGLDRVAGWKHREYRQVLAWLVCDLQARGAGHVALAGPYGPAIFTDDLAPLRLQVDDIATAYRCRVISCSPLVASEYWTVQPGVLGTALNASGTRARDTLFAEWLTAVAP